MAESPDPVVTPGPGVGAAPSPRGIDPRGPRFNAAVTTVVLAVTLVTGWWQLLAFQALMFAIAAVIGLQYSPYSYLFRYLVRPRLAPPTELEDPEPPRFAQVMGLVVTGIGLILAGLAVPYAVEVFAGLALIAALLNATIGLCIGCEIYLRLNLGQRLGQRLGRV